MELKDKLDILEKHGFKIYDRPEVVKLLRKTSRLYRELMGTENKKNLVDFLVDSVIIVTDDFMYSYSIEYVLTHTVEELLESYELNILSRRVNYYGVGEIINMIDGSRNSMTDDEIEHLYNIVNSYLAAVTRKL